MLKGKITLFILSVVAQLVIISLSAFAQCTITFIPEVIGHGSIEPSQPITLNPDDCALFEFKPDDGYKVCDVRLVDERSGIESEGAAMDSFYYCHDIPCDEIPYQDWQIILRVYFCPFNIEVKASVGGSISPSGLVKADYMSCQKFAIAPDPCWHIKDILLDGRSIFPSVTFTGKNAQYEICNIRSDHEIEAVFERDVCQISVGISNGGRIEPWGQVSANCGEKKTFRIIPDKYYEVADLFIDGKSVGAVSEYEFSCEDCGNALCQHTIMATFEKPSCNIKASSTGPGRLVMLSDINPLYGDKIKFRMIPDDCCYIKDVIVNDKSIGGIIDYETICQSSDFSIKAIFETSQYMIKSSANIGGKIDPLGETKTECGSNLVLNIIPNDCYIIKDVVVDGASMGAIETHEFKNIRSDHLIEAKFEKLSYTIIAISEGNGKIEPFGEIVVNCGESQKYILTPLDCSKISDLIVDGKPVAINSEYVFDNVRENHIIFALFESERPVIKATAGTGGSIVPSGNVELDCRESMTFNINSNPSYIIEDVKVDGKSVGAVMEYKFETITANHEIEAVFKQIHNITVKNTPNGKITPSENAKIIDGGNYTFKIKPDPCYTISDILIDGNSIGEVSEYVFENVTSDHSIEAKFALNPYIINATSNGGGKIEPNGDIIVNCNESQAFTITPDNCNQIKDVLIDGKSSGAIDAYKFSAVKENHTIQAIFEPITYIISVAPTTSGKIEPSGEIVANCGANITFSIAPDDCFHVADVIIDGELVDVVDKLELIDIKANHVISVIFEQNSYTINASSESGGNIEPSGKIDILCGESKKFIIKPDACYMIKGVIIDGKSIGAINEYEFVNVTSSHTIQTIFEKIQYTIIASAEENGSIEPYGEVKISCSDKSEFTIKSNDGYLIDDILVDGKSIIVDPDKETFTYTFDKADSDHKISAKFKEKKITAIESDKEKMLPFGQVKAENSDYIGETLPAMNDLLQNYPNPFNPETWIPFSLIKGSDVSIKIFDSKGCLIRLMELGYKEAGFYASRDKSVYWDGKNDIEEEVSSGVYFYTIQAGDFFAIKKMLIRR